MQQKDAIITGPYPIKVDYALTLDQMIDVGAYDHTDRTEIMKRFSVEGEGQLELQSRLILLDRVVTNNTVWSEFERYGFRGARIEEILSFGAKYPDVQREFMISGDVIHGQVFLGHSGSQRHLRFSWRRKAPARSRFLVLPIN